METKDNLKNIIEAILFASGDPISVSVLKTSLDVDAKTINAAVRELQEEYAQNKRGLAIVTMNSSIQMATSEEYAGLVEEILSPIRSERLTKSAIEVLSIIAYRQPITRSEIADIRGVRSDYLINTLVRKGLAAECGKKDTLGHPAMFATTEMFLRDFNLRDISQLPKLECVQEEDELLEMMDLEPVSQDESPTEEEEKAS